MRSIGPIRVTPLDRQIGDRIGRLLAERQVKQHTVAARLGLGMPELDARLRGAVRFNAEQLYELSRMLDVKVAAFFQD